jgi:chromate transport protein ChrA
MTNSMKLRIYTAVAVAKLRYFAPYAAIELVLPGGSLMALLLWLYRRHGRASVSARP